MTRHISPPATDFLVYRTVVLRFFNLNIKARHEIPEFLNVNLWSIHLIAFDIDLSWNIFTSHKFCSLLIEQLINLEKVRTENLKFRTDLRSSRLSYGWLVSNTVHNCLQRQIAKKITNRKTKLVLSTLVTTWLSNTEFHLRPICRAANLGCNRFRIIPMPLSSAWTVRAFWPSDHCCGSSQRSRTHVKSF